MNGARRSTDVVIIGGGAAGISAALWCDELGMDAVLIEMENELGGQLRHVYNPILNYPGVSAANGIEMLSEFEKSVGSRNFVRTIGIKVESIDVGSMSVRLRGPEPDVISCNAIVLATGVRRRSLRIPGETEFLGKGILESGSRDKVSVRGKKVLIVGGGDAAFENALILSKFAATVSVVFRRTVPTARREFVEAATAESNVVLLPSTVVTRIAGGETVDQVELKDRSGLSRTEFVDAVLIRIGVEPNSELVRGIVATDDSSYVKVDHTGKTSIEGVYAIGDVANKRSPTLSTAVGTGATAAKAIFHSINNPEAL